jgi:uncharacterized membrane protein (UPF0127 family)
MSNKTPKKQPEEIESALKTPVKKKRYLIFGIVMLIVGVLAVYSGVSSLLDNKTRMLTPNGFITVEIADTPETRKQGLSGRESLSDSEGMLFKFDATSADNCLVMRDMLISIDMVWMNENREVVTVIPAVAPETYLDIFCPEQPAKYSLELASGNAEKLEITPGTKLRW